MKALLIEVVRFLLPSPEGEINLQDFIDIVDEFHATECSNEQ
jgi:hypothetical protein